MIAGVSPRGPASQGSIAVICGTLESTESRVREEGCHRLGGTVPGRVVFIALPTRLKMFLRRDATRRVQIVVVSAVALLELGIRPIDSSPSLSAPAVAHPKIGRLVASLRGPHEENDKERF